jgi:hypothetical protein
LILPAPPAIVKEIRGGNGAVMTKRAELRAMYIAGWYEKDAAKLEQSTRADFQFDDPAEPEPIARDGLAAYMARWDAHAGGHNDWILQDEVRQDKDGILTDWMWWAVVGTELTGAAMVKTSDEGVFLERIAYFTR